MKYLTGTLVGTIPSVDTPVRMAYNGTTVAIADGSALRSFNPSTLALTTVSNNPAECVEFIDGYFVFNHSGTGQFQISQLYGTTIDPLDFATAEGSPDKLISLIADHRELWLFGENSTEVWFNSGNTDFPFERIQGAFIEQGCAAKYSVAKMDNTVFWLSSDDRGQGTVQRAAGYQPQRISTHALEFAIAGYSRIDDAVAYTYQQEGHSFYLLTFPTGNATWCFDASTGLWHERAWRNPLDGSLNRHRSSCHAAISGTNIVGDWETGYLYELDLDTYTDNSNPITRMRSCPHLASDLKWQFFNSLQIDMETGIGVASGQGVNPQVMLQCSDDGGLTWGNAVWATAGGQIGATKTRVRWRRLGKSRDRVFKVTITDPVKVVMVGASADVAVGPA